MSKKEIQTLIDEAPSSWVKMFKRYGLGKKPTVDKLIDVVLDYTPSMRSSGAEGKAKFKPPAKVRQEAMEGIRLSWEHNYTSDSGIGLVRAMQLVVKPKIWERSVKRMHSYFARSGKDTPKRYMAWLNWGGDSGKAWVDQIMNDHSFSVNPRRNPQWIKAYRAVNADVGIMTDAIQGAVYFFPRRSTAELWASINNATVIEREIRIDTAQIMQVAEGDIPYFACDDNDVIIRMFPDVKNPQIPKDIAEILVCDDRFVRKVSKSSSNPRRRNPQKTKLVPKEQVRMKGFSKDKTIKATPHIPVVLGFIEELLGEEILFPTPIRPMTKAEFSEGRQVIDSGHPRGAGHGQYDPDLQEVAVNGNMDVVDIVANILHENLHHARPEWSEEIVRDTTGQGMEYIYGFYTLGKPYADGRLKANPRRRNNKKGVRDEYGLLIPDRYLTGYKGKERKKRIKEIGDRRKEYQDALDKYGDEAQFPSSVRKKLYKPFETDKGKASKSSKYTVEAKKRGFKGSLKEKSKAASKYYGAKIPVSILEEVRDRGMAAWASGGHRAGQTPHSWGIARVNSFLVGGKTFFTADFDLVKKLSPKASMAITGESLYAPNLSVLFSED